MHWLPNRRAAACTNCGSWHAAELIETLSLPAFKQRPNVVQRANPSANGQRHEDLLGRAANDVEHDVAGLVAGGDVQKHQLVGPFLLIAGRHRHRVAGVAEVDEIRPLHDPPAIDVQTGNDTFGEHEMFAESSRMRSLRPSRARPA